MGSQSENESVVAHAKLRVVTTPNHLEWRDASRSNIVLA